MLRNVLFASAVLSVSTSLALLAPVYAEDDESKSNAAQQQQKSATNDRETEGKTSTTREGRSGQNASGQAGQAGQGAAGQRGAGQGQSKGLDHKIATIVALGNQEEVALGQIGAKKATNEDVKHFATMMVTDHHQILTQLEKFAPEASQPGYLDGGRQSGQEARSGKGGANQNRNNVQQAGATDDATSDSKVQTTGGQREGAAGTSGAGTAGAGAAGGDMHAQSAQLEREIAQQCLASAQEKLQDKTGAEFDKCFMGLQVAKHMTMRDKLIVFQRHASGDLKQLLATGQKKTEEHLAKAEELMKSLDQSGSSSGQSNQNNQNNRNQNQNQKGASTNNTNKATDANKSKDNE